MTEQPREVQVDLLALKIRDAFWDSWAHAADPRASAVMPARGQAPHPQAQEAWRAAARAVLDDGVPDWLRTTIDNAIRAALGTCGAEVAEPATDIPIGRCNQPPGHTGEHTTTANPEGSQHHGH